MNTALDTNFAIPGDASFPLNQVFEPPRDRNEAETLRQYIMQMRQELAQRLLGRLYADGDAPSKVSLLLPNCKCCPDIADFLIVVVEFHKAEIHGPGAISCADTHP